MYTTGLETHLKLNVFQDSEPIKWRIIETNEYGETHINPKYTKCKLVIRFIFSAKSSVVRFKREMELVKI